MTLGPEDCFEAINEIIYRKCLGTPQALYVHYSSVTIVSVSSCQYIIESVASFILKETHNVRRIYTLWLRRCPTSERLQSTTVGFNILRDFLFLPVEK